MEDLLWQYLLMVSNHSGQHPQNLTASCALKSLRNNVPSLIVPSRGAVAQSEIVSIYMGCINQMLSRSLIVLPTDLRVPKFREYLLIRAPILHLRNLRNLQSASLTISDRETDTHQDHESMTPSGVLNLSNQSPCHLHPQTPL